MLPEIEEALISHFDVLLVLERYVDICTSHEMLIYSFFETKETKF